MAFTIDFGNEGETKMASGKTSLSQFLPSKVRRSFKSRSLKGQRSEDEDGDKEVSIGVWQTILLVAPHPVFAEVF